MVRNVENNNCTVFSCFYSDDEKEHKEMYDFTIDSYLSTNEKNKSLNNDNSMLISETRPYGKWFENIFTNNEKNKCIAYNGVLSLHRDDIIKKPVSYYEKIIKEVDKHNNPEALHYIERSWYSIFYPYNENAIFEKFTV